LEEHVEVKLKVPKWLWEAALKHTPGDRGEAEAFLKVLLQDGIRGTLMDIVESGIKVGNRMRGLKYVLENGNKHYEAMEKALRKFLGDDEEWGL